MTTYGRSGLWRTLMGPQEIGRGSAFWVAFVAIGVAVLGFPLVGSQFALSNLASFLIYVPMGIGLALLWGYNGVLSFGQAAFFAIAAYVYGVVAGNLVDVPGGTLLAAIAGICACAVVAAFFGYFVFYGQVSGWIIPLLLMVLSLILETFTAQTAGYQWRIGSVLLGGYNGMTGIPSLQVGPLVFDGASIAFYYLASLVTIVVYLGMRLLVNSHYGHVVTGIRDDVERTRMLGYNVNLIQIQVFVLSAGLAGLSGILYVSWGNYINPSSMGLLAATLPVIWVAVGGRSSLLAVLLSTIALRWLTDALAVKGGEYAFLIMGVLLLATMLFFPEGIVVMLARQFGSRRADRSDASAVQSR